jgi:single-strand DNA-binding protein
MQFITITGRVSKDAETRVAGKSDVTNFNCAVDQGWGSDKQTNWYRVAIWGDRGGKLAPYILKGQKVTVTGELVIGEYQGKPQYEIRAADVDCFMQSKGGDGSQGAPLRREDANGQTAFEREMDDDVPFASCDIAWEHRVR